LRICIIIIVFFCVHFGFSQSLSDTTAIIKKYRNAYKISDSNSNNAILDLLDCELSSKEIGFTKGLAVSNYYLGLIYLKRDNYSHSRKRFLMAKKYFLAMGSKSTEANILGKIAETFYKEENYDSSITYYLNSIPLLESLDEVREISTNYTNIGNMFLESQKPLSAITYYKNALSIDIEIKDSLGITTQYANLGNAFLKQKKVDSAKHYYNKSIEIGEKINSEDIGIDYLNLGELYYNESEFDKAKSYYLKSYETLSLQEDKKYELGILANNLGLVYQKTNQLKEAKRYFDKSWQLAKETSNKKLTIEISESLASYFEQEENHKKALEFHKIHLATKDSLFKIESEKEISRLHTQFETEKKDQQIALQQTENKMLESEAKRKNFILYGISAVLFIIAFLSFFLYRNVLAKKKANYKLEKQKAVIEQQKAVVEEKNKEIFDSITYAERIQVALLQSDKEIYSLVQDAFVFFKPKDIVSGDFYWSNTIGSKTYIAAADCTGHGVPGAFMSLLGMSFLNELCTLPENESVNVLVDKLRDKVVKTLNQANNENRDGLDIGLASIDYQKDKIIVEFCGANNPAWIASKNKELETKCASEEKILAPNMVSETHNLFEIKGDKQPVGFHYGLEKPFINHQFELQKGDTIYLLTDGFPDQFGGPKEKKFRYKPLKQLLLKNQLASMQNQHEVLNNQLRNWMGTSNEQVDDICIVGIKI
jgi:serine phosphatase RsbU (regulator of sigma subunit)